MRMPERLGDALTAIASPPASRLVVSIGAVLSGDCANSFDAFYDCD